MVQLDCLTGNKTGTRWTPQNYPVRIGRSQHETICLDDDGVWDHHLEIHLDRSEGAVLTASAQAFVHINGQTVEQQTTLKNGDVIQLGKATLRFGLTPTRQRGLALREVSTWVGLALLCLGQVCLIYWLVGWDG
jgi:pSer/pThr/pTyr-binding forkhead associated (FHA) protein